MKDWEKIITAFLDKAEKEEMGAEIDALIEEGIKPMLLDYMALRDAAGELADLNAKALGRALNGNRIRNSPLFHALSAVFRLTTEEENLQ